MPSLKTFRLCLSGRLGSWFPPPPPPGVCTSITPDPQRYTQHTETQAHTPAAPPPGAGRLKRADKAEQYQPAQNA